MAAITDSPFRSFMKELGAGIVVSELISATGIEYKSQKTLDLAKYAENQRPVGIQLFGENPDQMANAAKFVEQSGADFVDVNFGCPVPKVVKKGAGSAMMKDLPAMYKLLTAMTSAVKIPVTIKIRTGWDNNTRNAKDAVRVAEDSGITWVAIHGRTRAQGYDGFADWEFIGEVKKGAKIPIIGNGDVISSKFALDKLSRYNLDAIMIGRGALKNPYIFQDCYRQWSSPKQNSLETSIEARTQNSSIAFAYKKLIEYLQQDYQERILEIQAKKFAAWYSTGYPGAANLRKSIFQCKNFNEIYTVAMNFFETIDPSLQENHNNEGFLMGGHG
jgi:tRNA-dihydrouridine synthase B